MAMTKDEYQAVIDDINQRSLAIAMRTDYTIADRLDELAAQQPEAIFLIFEEREISYGALAERAAEYARIAQSLGLAKGDCAALMIANRPEFFFVWLGLLSIGVSVALINDQIRGAAIVRCLESTASAALFIDSPFLPQFIEARQYGQFPVSVVLTDNPPEPKPSSDAQPEDPPEPKPTAEELLENLPENCLKFEQALRAAEQGGANSPIHPAPVTAREGLKNSAPACYMFTSGTTGMPKAVIISHSKWLSTGHRLIGMAAPTREDIFYCVLPLYHGAALMSLFSTVFALGATAVLRRRFSVRNFWKDVLRYKVTVFQYVGEVCRYLVNKPPAKREQNHKLRILIGAGMGFDVWKRFTERFGDQVRIYEGWGSTESNCNTTNLDNRPGSCGRIPYWDKTFMRLVRYDVAKDEYPRDEQGFFQLAEPNENGEMIAQVHTADGTPVSPFDGYTDAEANEKKLLRDVFERGDCWFASGDLLRVNKEGYCYFVDRLGDTFRWKSENISANEVERALSAYKEAEMVNVYGVRVPGHEGRAGMAAIKLVRGGRWLPRDFCRMAVLGLPPQAVPLFVRIVDESDLTSTFKLRKVDLQREGYDPVACRRLYVLDPEEEAYVPYSNKALEKVRVSPFDPENP